MGWYIFVDLDKVVFDDSARDKAACNVVKKMLEPEYLPEKEYEKAFNRLFYSTQGLFRPELFRLDTPYPEVRSKLIGLEVEFHARILFLSSRPEYTQESTMESLKEYDLLTSIFNIYRPVILKPSGARPLGGYQVRSDYWKVATIQSFLSLFRQTNYELRRMVNFLMLFSTLLKSREK